MKKTVCGIALLLAGFVVWVPNAVACSCAAFPDIPNAVSGADVVFAGRVVGSDRFMAQFEVEKIWKGQERSRITMLTGARDLGNGRWTSTNCDFGYVTGQRYIVYATGASNALIAPGCSRTSILSESELKGLDAVVPHRKVADEVRLCAAGSTRPPGEIRLAVADSKSKALPGVTAVLDGGSERMSTMTDTEGRATFRELPPGAYRITLNLNGYGPKQSRVTVPADGCIEASLYLLRPIE